MLNIIIGFLVFVSFTPTCFAQQTVVSDNDPTLFRSEPKNSVLTRFRLINLKGNLADLLEEHIAVLSPSAEAQIVTPSFLRKLRNDLVDILATEGYFSPSIQIQKNRDAEFFEIYVEAGARTTIKEVSIRITGALTEAANRGQVEAIEKRDALLNMWTLTKDAPFRQNDWNQSKTLLMDHLRSQLYAGATLVDSRATIEPETQTAILEVDVDSGAAYTLGEIQVIGLERYPLWLLDRFNPPKKGEPYSSARLIEFQRALQNSAYFSTVAFNVEPDITKANALPIEILVTERQTRDLGFSAGYSSNTGFRAEVNYRDRNLFDRIFDLRTALRIEQRQQLAYADLYLPPNDQNQLDSMGVLLDRSHIEGLLQTRSAIGIKRTTTKGVLEQRIGMNYTQEKSRQDFGTTGFLDNKSQAFVGSLGWTWRAVDDIFAPHQGHRLQVESLASYRGIISDQSFFRLYGKYQYWFPIGKQDNLILRWEIGKVFSGSADHIPNNYLFRTGGNGSVRGYAYQSLGVKSGEAVLGGRVMSAAGIEYVHWTTPVIGVASFIDAGNASQSFKEFRAVQGSGIGLRIKTPAGPIALDFAYGHQTKKLRLEFSIAIAF